MRELKVMLVLAALVSVASGQMIGTGPIQPQEGKAAPVIEFLGDSDQNPAGAAVLVWSTGNPNNQTQAIAAWIQASGRFGSVVGENDDDGKSLAELQAYDAVLYFTNGCGGDMNANGDVLADYADTGARLVVAVFAWANQGCNTLGGRFINDEISPYVFEGGSLYTNANLDANDGSCYFDDVNSLTGLFRDNVRLTSGAVERGRWSDGEPLVAVKGNVVGVNLFPDDAYGNVSGDIRPLFINALSCETGPPTPRCIYQVSKVKNKANACGQVCDTCPYVRGDLVCTIECGSANDCPGRLKGFNACANGAACKVSADLIGCDFPPRNCRQCR
ncbi:MAG: hypothetical protein KJ057_01615 [Phycisphaerae bacterium]|nr:MAG: hypothetical protein EDS66_06160 [Planctomycetota bacterium]KAB2945847.1 MAG: hypothetical protein F9K17_09305 [Phycisphaerae bacterium]MBE7455894.1 hypothetical protein [Planctomycetia bacterium]MCK6465253.1 hypothetical protein [Phycisphaerae bacterium]MCL4717152.1 hypothetical protein [Phycisphaerae bacterium]